MRKLQLEWLISEIYPVQKFLLLWLDWGEEGRRGGWLEIARLIGSERPDCEEGLVSEPARLFGRFADDGKRCLSVLWINRKGWSTTLCLHPRPEQKSQPAIILGSVSSCQTSRKFRHPRTKKKKIFRQGITKQMRPDSSNLRSCNVAVKYSVPAAVFGEPGRRR